MLDDREASKWQARIGETEDVIGRRVGRQMYGVSGLANQHYYVRLRGRITGPYDPVEIEKRLRRGQLSRVHEISTDGINWEQIRDPETLLGSLAAPSHLPAEPEANAPPPDATHFDTAYCYSNAEGIVKGPVSLADLQELTRSGELSPNDPVRKVEDERWILAGTHPELISVFAALPDAGAAAGEGESMWSRHGGFALVTGFSAAAVFLVATYMPHGRDKEDLIWWWSGLRAPGALALAVCSVYLTGVSLALLFVSVLYDGRQRGWWFVVSGACGLLLLLTAAWTGGGIAVAICLVAGTACAALVTVTAFDFFPSTPTLGEAGRVAVGIGAIVAACSGILVVAWEFVARSRLAEPMTPGVVIGLSLGGVGLALCFSAGLTGLMSTRPTESLKRTKSTLILGSSALAILAMAGLCIGFHAYQSSPAGSTDAPFALLRTLRLLVVEHFLLLLVAAGLPAILFPSDEAPGTARSPESDLV